MKLPVLQKSVIQVKNLCDDDCCIFIVRSQQKLMVKKCPNLAKNKPYLKHFWSSALWKCATHAKIWNGYESYTYILTQMRVLSLNISSHSGHICRSMDIKVTKSKQKLALTNGTNSFATTNPSKHCPTKFSLG